MEAATAAQTAEQNGTHPDGLEPEGAVQDLVIEVGGQLSMQVGGKRPTGSSLRLVGGKIAVEGQFDKGQTIRLALEVQIGEVAFVDERDSKTREVVGCERRHKARIIGVSVEG